MRQWNISGKSGIHEVVFESWRISGKAKLRIDGRPTACLPILLKKVGIFYPVDLDGSELFIRMDSKKNPVDLIQDGLSLEAGTPVDEATLSKLWSSKAAQSPLAVRERSGMGSFLAFTVLTYLNLFLILTDASLSFPFSAMVPQIVLGLFLYAGTPSTLRIVAGVLVSAALTSVYLVFYLLARKNRLWPIVVTLILVALDTLATLIFLPADDLSFYLINAAFHVWVLCSLVQLLITRRRKIKSTLAEL